MEDVLARAQEVLAGYDEELRRELPENAEIFDAHIHLGTDIDGFQGVTAAPAKPFSADRHHSLEGKDMFPAVWKNGELVKAQ